MSEKLCRAAARGNANKVRQLLEEGEDVNWVDGAPNPKIVRRWIRSVEEAGYDFLPKTGVGKTPLLCAVSNGQSEAAAVLLQRGADVRLADAVGRTALMFAIEQRHMGLVESLIAAGADANAVDASGMPALSWAVESESRECVDVLVQAGASVDPDVAEKQSPIAVAATLNSESLVNHLLDLGAVACPHIVYHAFLFGWVDVIRRLLAAGLDVNEPLASGEWPIEFFRNEEILDLLLSHGADPSRCSRSILHTLLDPSDAEALRKLVDAGADLDAPITDFGETYLMRLASDDVEGTMTRLALELGARVDAVDQLGDSAIDYTDRGPNRGNAETIRLLQERLGQLPNRLDQRATHPTRFLVEACRVGDLEAVRSLLDEGADINAFSRKHSGTALAIASRAGQLEVVKELLRRKALLPTTDYHQPLAKAAGSGHTEVVCLLLEAGSDVNAYNQEEIGYTALMMAAADAHLGPAEVLIKAGADVDAENQIRDTALSQARKFELRKGVGNPVVDLLLEAGATNYGANPDLRDRHPKPNEPS